MSEMPRQRGLLFCLSGPSGVGKGTVIDEVRRRRPQVAHSISITTRPLRPGEIEGVHYYFRSPEQFHQLLVEGEILEYDNYCRQLLRNAAAPHSKPCAMRGVTS